MDPIRPPATQAEIDRALENMRRLDRRTAGHGLSALVARLPSQGQVVKLALVAISGAGVVIAALFHFWFSQVSDVPLRYTPEWKQGVDRHVEQATDAFARLGAVETKVGALEHGIDHLHTEVKDMRADQLEFYRWQAERAGDRPRALRFDARLKAAQQ